MQKTVKITANVSKKNGKTYVSIHSSSMRDWRGVNSQMLRDVVADMDILKKYAEMTDEQLETIAIAQEMKLNEIAQQLANDNAKNDKRVVRESDVHPTTSVKTYRPGTFTDFVNWMQSAYNVDAAQARQWITDVEYQAEYQAYLKENEISAQRPTKRENVQTQTQSGRPTKRETSAKQTSTSGGKEVSFSVIVNGKKLEMQADNKSQAIDKLNALEKSLTNAKGHTRLIESNAREIRERGASPSHLFDDLVKQEYVTLK